MFFQEERTLSYSLSKFQQYTVYIISHLVFDIPKAYAFNLFYILLKLIEFLQKNVDKKPEYPTFIRMLPV